MLILLTTLSQVASQFVRKVDSASIELQPCSDSSLWTAKCDIAWEDLTIDRSFIVGKGRFTVVRRGSVKIKGKITQAAIKNLKGKLTLPPDVF